MCVKGIFSECEITFSWHKIEYIQSVRVCKWSLSCASIHYTLFHHTFDLLDRKRKNSAKISPLEGVADVMFKRGTGFNQYQPVYGKWMHQLHLSFSNHSNGFSDIDEQILRHYSFLSNHNLHVCWSFFHPPKQIRNPSKYFALVDSIFFSLLHSVPPL